jgi:hypothetical protein
MSNLEISAGQQTTAVEKLLVDFVSCHVCSSTSEKIAWCTSPVPARPLFMKSHRVLISLFSSDQPQGEYFTVIANCDFGHGDRLVVLGSRMEVNHMLSKEYSAE